MILGVPAGEHTVLTQLIGFDPGKQTVTIVAGETAALDIRLFHSAIQPRLLGVVATGSGLAAEARVTGPRDPLIYVDGVRMDATSVGESVDPGDIERIEVVIDEAVARYGEEASGGVIQIFLKHESPELPRERR